MIDDDLLNDEAEWDRWLSLSDAEIETELAVAEREYDEWWRTLTPQQQYRCSARSLLELSPKTRRMSQSMGITYLMEHVKRMQKRMWALRYWRRTGIMPSMYN